MKRKNRSNKTVNRAGGEAYAQTPELRLASMLLTSFAQDQFYRSQKDTFDELVALIAQCDPQFVAKAGIYARTQYGMRSITHVLAAELAPYLSGKSWAKNYYERTVFRPDDMTETVAYYLAKGGKTLPNAMKKGFAKAFDKFDGYQLAKYRGEKNAVKLIDIVNLVHPTPTQRNAKALTQLVNGDLRSQNTWESKLTQAGKKATSKAEKADLKHKAWADLIQSGRIGYFALLRNLRNIVEQAPNQLDAALSILTDKRRITNPRNLVMPFRYLVAYKQFGVNAPEISGHNANSRKIRQALAKAVEIACENVPNLENTLVVIDNSGSMTSPASGSLHLMCSEAGAIFGMLLAKQSNADLMEFGTSARYIDYDLNDDIMKFGEGFSYKNQVGHGTDFKSIFRKANRQYDRIVIFSDMQGWIGQYSPQTAYQDYRNRTGANPFVYMFDLGGYGSTQLNNNDSKVFQIAGFNEKVFEIMSLLETDRQALVKAINNVEL
ncbi:MAG: TROVE domain-containing protein [Saprospiraceae bacterium]